MKKCPKCGAELLDNAVVCLSCGEKLKKPFYKKAWFWVIAGICVIGIIGATGSTDTDKTKTATVAPSQNVSQSEKSENNETEAVEKQEVVEEKQVDNTPTEYKSALVKAKIYSDEMYMSKIGIYDQLTSEYGEKFSKEAAQYAIDNLSADYKLNALKKAEVYQKEMSMSPSAIRGQLTSEYGEKFTKEEADYAVANLK